MCAGELLWRPYVHQETTGHKSSKSFHYNIYIKRVSFVAQNALHNSSIYAITTKNNQNNERKLTNHLPTSIALTWKMIAWFNNKTKILKTMKIQLIQQKWFSNELCDYLVKENIWQWM